jgi:hypothetical protein
VARLGAQQHPAKVEDDPFDSGGFRHKFPLGLQKTFSN